MRPKDPFKSAQRAAEDGLSQNPSSPHPPKRSVSVAFADSLRQTERLLEGADAADIVVCQVVALTLALRITKNLTRIATSAMVANPAGAPIVDAATRESRAVERMLGAMISGAVPWLNNLDSGLALRANELGRIAMQAIGWMPNAASGATPRNGRRRQ